jgi:hypothetical protein
VHRHKNRGEEKMPRGDRTGPSGFGPLTGRAAGFCAGYPVPGSINTIRGFGRSLGRGHCRGFGRGFGRGWRVQPPVVQPQSPEQKVVALENYQKELEAEKADLEQEMNENKSRIEELKATSKQ